MIYMAEHSNKILKTKNLPLIIILNLRYPIYKIPDYPI